MTYWSDADAIWVTIYEGLCAAEPDDEGTARTEIKGAGLMEAA